MQESCTDFTLWLYSYILEVVIYTVGHYILIFRWILFGHPWRGMVLGSSRNFKDISECLKHVSTGRTGSSLLRLSFWGKSYLFGTYVLFSVVFQCEKKQTCYHVAMGMHIIVCLLIIPRQTIQILAIKEEGNSWRLMRCSNQNNTIRYCIITCSGLKYHSQSAVFCRSA